MKCILVGLIGANIQKSLSPALQEDACVAAGVHGHYHLVDLDVLAGRSLNSLLDAVRATGFARVNVTYPCKEAVLPLLDEVSAEARQIGAVNTVTIDRYGRTAGYNTDGWGRHVCAPSGRELPALHGALSRYSSHATQFCRGGSSQRQNARRSWLKPC